MSPNTPDDGRSRRASGGSRSRVVRRVRETAPLFAALGDSTRLQIVGRLAGGAVLSIAALTAGTGVTRQAMTKHLQVLDEVGLVHSTWQGRERQWPLEPARITARGGRSTSSPRSGPRRWVGWRHSSRGRKRTSFELRSWKLTTDRE